MIFKCYTHHNKTWKNSGFYVACCPKSSDLVRLQLIKQLSQRKFYSNKLNYSVIEDVSFTDSHRYVLYIYNAYGRTEPILKIEQLAYPKNNKMKINTAAKFISAWYYNTNTATTTTANLNINTLY